MPSALIRVLNHAGVGLLSVVRHQASPDCEIPIFDGHRPPPFLRLAITHSGPSQSQLGPPPFSPSSLRRPANGGRRHLGIAVDLKAQATTPRNWVTTESVRTPPRGRLRRNYVLLQLVPRRIRQLTRKPAFRRARALMPPDPETAASSCPRGGSRSVMSTPPSPGGRTARSSRGCPALTCREMRAVRPHLYAKASG